MTSSIFLVVGTILVFSALQAIIAIIAGIDADSVDRQIKSEGVFQVSLWQFAISGILLIGIAIGMT